MKIKKATKDRTLVAINLWANQLPEYLYQQVADLYLISRDK